MKLSQQLTSLELSKKMAELGFEQDSLWYWEDDMLFREDEKSDNAISAFTVAELGELMPPDFETGQFLNMGGGWYCKTKPYDCVGDTEANARAKMLIYLKEEGLI